MRMRMARSGRKWNFKADDIALCDDDGDDDEDDDGPV